MAPELREVHSLARTPERSRDFSVDFDPHTHAPGQGPGPEAYLASQAQARAQARLDYIPWLWGRILNIGQEASPRGEFPPRRVAPVRPRGTITYNQVSGTFTELFFKPFVGSHTRPRSKALAPTFGPNTHPALQPKEDLQLLGASQVGRPAERPVAGSFPPYYPQGAWVWPVARKWAETTAGNIWESTPRALTVFFSPRSGRVRNAVLDVPYSLWRFGRALWGALPRPPFRGPAAGLPPLPPRPVFPSVPRYSYAWPRLDLTGWGPAPINEGAPIRTVAGGVFHVLTLGLEFL